MRHQEIGVNWTMFISRKARHLAAAAVLALAVGAGAAISTATPAGAQTKEEICAYAETMRDYWLTVFNIAVDGNYHSTAEMAWNKYSMYGTYTSNYC